MLLFIINYTVQCVWFSKFIQYFFNMMYCRYTIFFWIISIYFCNTFISIIVMKYQSEMSIGITHLAIFIFTVYYLFPQWLVFLCLPEYDYAKKNQRVLKSSPTPLPKSSLTNMNYIVFPSSNTEICGSVAVTILTINTEKNNLRINSTLIMW